MPLIGELVELEVKVAEARADDVPVQLLADQGQRDQLDERELQQPAYLLASVRA